MTEIVPDLLAATPHIGINPEEKTNPFTLTLLEIKERTKENEKNQERKKYILRLFQHPI